MFCVSTVAYFQVCFAVLSNAQVFNSLSSVSGEPLKLRVGSESDDYQKQNTWYVIWRMRRRVMCDVPCHAMWCALHTNTSPLLKQDPKQVGFETSKVMRFLASLACHIHWGWRQSWERSTNFVSEINIENKILTLKLFSVPTLWKQEEICVFYIRFHIRNLWVKCPW